MTSDDLATRLRDAVLDEPVTRYRLRIYRDHSDWWIGVYFGPHHVYICPLPTLVVRFPRQQVLNDE